jgi:hypothetical protein
MDAPGSAGLRPIASAEPSEPWRFSLAAVGQHRRLPKFTSFRDGLDRRVAQPTATTQVPHPDHQLGGGRAPSAG